MMHSGLTLTKESGRVKYEDDNPAIMVKPVTSLYIYMKPMKRSSVAGVIIVGDINICILLRNSIVEINKNN